MGLDKPFEVHFLNLDYLFYQVYRFFMWLYATLDYYLFGGRLPGGYLETGAINGGADGSFIGVSPIFSSLSVVLSLLAVFFIFVIVYSSVRLYEIRSEEQARLEKVLAIPPEDTPKNEQWEKVQERVNSANPSDWKLAVLEADNMLDEMVRRMGFRGENLGERLKAVEPSDFTSINSAWEAHKVRNRIAHESSEFFLSQREARRIVGLYEEVFREFHFI